MNGNLRGRAIWVALGLLALAVVLQYLYIRRMQRPHAPALMAPMPTAAVEGALYEARLDVVDPDGDPLTYRIIRAPEGLELAMENGPPTILWRPNGQQSGPHQVALEVLDATHRLSVEWVIQVEAINDPPVIRSEPPQGLARARGFHYKVWAVDEDDKDLTYTLIDAPAGMTVSPTGQIDWQPPDDVEDLTPFTVRVTDSQGVSVEQQITVRFEGIAKVGVVGDFFPCVAELDDTYMAGVSNSRLVIFAKDNAREFLAQRFTYARMTRQMVAFHDVVYVQSTNGVEYYDVRDRHAIKYLGTLEATVCFNARLQIWQDRLYIVQMNDNPALCYSLADPLKPERLPDFPMRSFMGMTFGPENAYCVTIQTLTVFDTRNLDAPRPIATVPLNSKSAPGGLALRDNYLYIATGRDMTIFDVADPAYPAIAKKVPNLNWNYYMNLDLNNTRMWLWGPNSLYAYDVRDPVAPQPIVNHGNSMVSEFMASTDHVYTVDADGKVQLADEVLPKFPYESDDLLSPAGLVTDGIYLYIYSRLNSFIYSLADPLKPTRISSFKLTQSLRPSMTASKGYLYTPWNVVDVRTPDKPRSVARLPGGDAIALNGDTVFIAKGDTVHIFDVKWPSAPVLLKEVKVGQAIGALASADGYLYLALMNGTFRTCRIEQDYRLTTLENLGVRRTNRGKPLHMALQGDWIYLALAGDGICAVDRRDPARPVVHGTYDTYPQDCEMVSAVPGAEGVAVSAIATRGMAVVDFSRPGTGREIGRFGTTDRTQAVAVVGDLIYSADRLGGLGILRLSVLPAAKAAPTKAAAAGAAAALAGAAAATKPAPVAEAPATEAPATEAPAAEAPAAE